MSAASRASAALRATTTATKPAQLAPGEHLRGVRAAGQQARHPCEGQLARPGEHQVAEAAAAEHTGLGEHGHLADRHAERRDLAARELEPRAVGDVDGDAPAPVGGDLRPPAELGQHVVGADGVPVVVEDVLGAPAATGFLVGDAEVDQRPPRAEPFDGKAAERHGHRRRRVEHVDRPAPPHLDGPVSGADQLAAEGIVRPAVGVGRHDVGVPHQAQCRSRWVGPFDPRDHRATARVRLELLDAGHRSFEIVLQQVGVAPLTSRIRGAVVDTLVADQSLQQFGGFPGEFVRHPAI